MEISLSDETVFEFDVAFSFTYMFAFSNCQNGVLLLFGLYGKALLASTHAFLT